jgi:hypothetical protein
MEKVDFEFSREVTTDETFYEWMKDVAEAHQVTLPRFDIRYIPIVTVPSAGYLVEIEDGWFIAKDGNDITMKYKDITVWFYTKHYAIADDETLEMLKAE